MRYSPRLTCEPAAWPFRDCTDPCIFTTLHLGVPLYLLTVRIKRATSLEFLDQIVAKF